MRRREFITLVGGATAWPFAARAQQPAKQPTIGFLGGQSRSTMSHLEAAFVQRLRELGWIEGSNIAIERRWVEGHDERAAEVAAEFVRLKVEVIFAGGTSNAVAAKQATSLIPIVFVAGDPVGTGLVASLARPGSNLTGVSTQSSDIAAKRLELMREVVPGLRRLAIMANSASLAAMLELREAGEVAGALDLEVASLEVRRAEDISRAIKSIKGSADALLVAADPLLNANRMRINTLAIGARLPTIYYFRDSVETAGLMSYGPNLADLFRRVGDHVDKILRGAKPADIPVEQPTRFELVINLITAQALSLDVPASVLARADEVIE
jgi:putative tryptophan/tyrosine transport system substrate-binding protein